MGTRLGSTLALARSGGLAFYGDVTRRWRWKRFEQLNWKTLTRVPVFEAEDASRLTVALDQAPGSFVDANALGGPAIEP